MRTLTRNTIIISAAMALAACATSPSGGYRPLVDNPGRNFAEYNTDIEACQALAGQRAGAAQGAAAGALAGAIFGALLAAAAGGDYSRNSAAAVGAVSGLAGGAGQGAADQRSIMARCMAGRGWNVLH